MMIALSIFAVLGVVFALLVLLVAGLYIDYLIDRWRWRLQTYRRLAAEDMAALRELLRMIVAHWRTVRRLLAEADARDEVERAQRQRGQTGA
jgi:predicted RND superfamily exporter protein